MDPALEVRDLLKQYGGVTAVDNLSFEVRRGEIFGLLGPKGSGKTTTIRTIMDIFRPDSGEVRVLGGPPRRGSAGPGSAIRRKNAASTTS